MVKSAILHLFGIFPQIPHWALLVAAAGLHCAWNWSAVPTCQGALCNPFPQSKVPQELVVVSTGPSLDQDTIPSLVFFCINKG